MLRLGRLPLSMMPPSSSHVLARLSSRSGSDPCYFDKITSGLGLITTNPFKICGYQSQIDSRQNPDCKAIQLQRAQVGQQLSPLQRALDMHCMTSGQA